MCQWGDDVLLYVPIPAHLSHTGAMRWDHKPVDRCIAPIVQALNDAGIYTANCCCGHGKEDGSIILHDGRVLIISCAGQGGWGKSETGAIRLWNTRTREEKEQP